MRLHDGVFLNRNLLFFEIRYKITKNYLSEDENRWRVVKGSEGLRQPFTILTCWYSDIYTEKVKGEGFSRLFFCTDNLGMEATISTAECFPSEAFWCTSEAFWCASEVFWQTAEALWRRFCSCFCQTLQPLNNNFKQIKTMPKYIVNSRYCDYFQAFTKKIWILVELVDLRQLRGYSPPNPSVFSYIRLSCPANGFNDEVLYILIF